MLPFRKILWPTDFSGPSYKALKTANELASHFSSKLNIVHVITPMPPIDKKISKKIAVHAIVTNGNPAVEIARIAESENVDLIVIATHGTSGWQRFFFGSVAEKVVRIASSPVLTIRGPQKDK
jgi:nucleotide-binding universal stress UspA family protein